MVEASGVLHIAFNRVGVWCVAVTYGVVILLRQDGVQLWAVAGCVFNIALSWILKHSFNQKRPVSDVCSGPGMPSTHAQSISFAGIFFILSIIGWLGVNGLSVILSGLVISVCIYLSWLRVLLRYHTTNQVVAGSVVGSMFSFLWFCTCDEMVLKANKSCLWKLLALLIVSVWAVFHRFCVNKR